VLLDSMELGKNIACNAALRENIFMMAVCVDLRIPLFLVGKPGSSKSLAKAIVASSMQGQASSNDLLKSFKQVYSLWEGYCIVCIYILLCSGTGLVKLELSCYLRISRILRKRYHHLLGV